MIEQFEKEFRSKGEVSTEEVGAWLERNGQIVFDVEKERKNFRTLQGRRFISSIKDRNGVREWFSYRDDETDQRLFAKTATVSDLAVLKGQKDQLEKKRSGLDKSIKKVNDRIFQLTTQQTIYDFIPSEGVAVVASTELGENAVASI
jgi:hypothetical protein